MASIARIRPSARRDEGLQKRFYACPRPGESREEFARRFRHGLLALVEEHRGEHPGDGDGDNAA